MQIALWRDMLDPYYLAVEELLVKFNHIISSYHREGKYSPIEEVNGRVKSISSMLDKARRKKIPIDQLEQNLDDIAGIRIICQFVEDIYKVAGLIRTRKDMEIKIEKDYIANPKPSGYRSYHIIVWYKVETISGTRKIPVEIQIRTLAMNFWATIEHSLQYKYRSQMPKDLSDKLKSSAQSIVQLDSEMSLVRDEIMDAQNSSRIRDNLINDILNDIQNLYKVANKREVEKIQDEFFKVYQKEDIVLLRRFSEQLNITVKDYGAQSL